MRLRDLSVAVGSMLLFTACAGNKPQVAYDSPPIDKWTGALQPTQQRSGALVVTSQTKSFGNVSMRRVAIGSMDRMRVTLTLALPVTSPTSLNWAILPNRCGSGDLPLIGFDQFPLLEIGNNGRGEVNADIAIDLTPNGSYHVNVYNGGQQLDNVVSCANLRYEPQRPE